jgi:osmotically-inducible protein OsmY
MRSPDRLLSVVVLVISFTTVSMFLSNVRAQQEASQPGAANGGVVATEQSKHYEHDSVQTSSEHLYNSPAERAHDDLLITEVKTSLAKRGITDRYPVEVDCDHGTIQLTGVVGSADEAKQAEQIALKTNGVVGVNNKLTWRQ